MQSHSFRLRSRRQGIGGMRLPRWGLALAAACSAPSAGSPPSAIPTGESATGASDSPPLGQAAPQLGKSPIEEVIRAMTREEKVRLVMGTGIALAGDLPAIAPPSGPRSKSRVPGSAAETYAIERLGIPSIVLADGPAGLRIEPTREDAPGKTYYATAFPIGTAIAASWDPSLAEQVGRAMGAEVRAHGVDVLLGPALNIQRIALGGRNFEYFSEDPLLSGTTAAAVTRGVQSAGVGTSIKHFAANNHEWNRNVLDVKLDERPLREIYLRGFEIAVREGHPWTVMSSYNKINGTYTSEDPRLLTEILRGEWGFDGLVMTDWFGGHDALGQLKAGNDSLMPGTERQRQELSDGLARGAIDEAVLEQSIANLLQLILKTPAFQPDSSRAPVDLKQGAAVARSAAAQGMVLLKNDKARLPLAAGTRVALFGNGGFEAVTGGTGSGDVNEAYSVSLAQGLAALGFTPDAALRERFEKHLGEENAKRPLRQGIQAFLPVMLAPEPALDAAAIDVAVRGNDAAVLTLRRSSGEFIDRSAEDFFLSAAEKALLRGVSRAFRGAGKPVIAVLNVGGPIEIASWRDQVDAILVAWEPGQEAGNAIADVLSGAVNPSGKLPMTFPKDWKDAPAAQGFPGTVLEPGNDLPPPFGGAKAAQVDYKDGLEVGYRNLGKRKLTPAYAFGHGLSYTTFGYGKLSVSPQAGASDRWTASIEITNTGKQPGTEVLQLYVSAPREGLPKPVLELRRFAKTQRLAPGEKQTLQLELGARDLSSFDPSASAWVAEKGLYTLRAGSSSTDLRQTAPLTLEKAVTTPLK